LNSLREDILRRAHLECRNGSIPIPLICGEIGAIVSTLKGKELKRHDSVVGLIRILRCDQIAEGLNAGWKKRGAARKIVDPCIEGQGLGWVLIIPYLEAALVTIGGRRLVPVIFIEETLGRHRFSSPVYELLKEGIMVRKAPFIDGKNGQNHTWIGGRNGRIGIGQGYFRDQTLIRIGVFGMGRLTDLNVDELIAVASVQQGIGLCIGNHVFIEGGDHRGGAETDGERVGIDGEAVPFRNGRNSGQFQEGSYGIYRAGHSLTNISNCIKGGRVSHLRIGMVFKLRVEGFGKIEYYDVEPSITVLEVKELFCDSIKQSLVNVVPFVNCRLLFESHTLAEAHVNQETPIKMYDTEMAKLILNTAVHSENSRMKMEKKSSAISSVQPMGRLRPWSDEDGKQKKGGLGLF